MFVAPSKSDADLRPGVFGSGNPPQSQLLKRWRRRGVPSSWRTLMCLCPVLGPRRDLSSSGHHAAVARPPYIQPRRLPARGNFGARSHGLDTGCLRFVPRIARSGRKTRFWRLTSLPGGIGYPQGSSERFHRCFLHQIPPSQACLARWMSPFSAVRNFRSLVESTTEPNSAVYTSFASLIKEG